ncbi:Hypothetical protein HEAR2268 [Herminiimonas arsenicoxydans]|uniref:Uncharacterized protein n=1 Tax=Herminiimonas arsenicoxydans TaxID=204773 RepID=A4G7B4_HERAR|nr:Hypothetical protein HEAR2268 [Herminiimonas arsenicoxydans]
MNFGNNGVNSINQGIGSVFRVLASAPMYKQQAADAAELNAARVFAQQSAGQKYGAEAEGLRMTNDNRRNIEEIITQMPDLTDAARKMYRQFGIGGDNNAERMAKATGQFQQQQAITDIQGGVDPTRTGQAYAAVSGKLPFEAVGSTGRNINGLTGLGGVLDPTVAKLYDRKIGSEIGENNAQAGAAGASAGLSNERRKEIQMGDVKPGTDEFGNPILFRAGTNGKVNVLDDLAPYRKSGSSDAALQKARGRVAEQVYKDKGVEPENRAAEIEARMAMINPPKEGAKSTNAPAAEPTMDAATLEMAGRIRAGFESGRISRDDARKQLIELGIK